MWSILSVTGGRLVSSVYSRFPSTISDWHDIIEILLKVALHIYSDTCVNQIYLGPGFVFGIDSRSVYTG